VTQLEQVPVVKVEQVTSQDALLRNYGNEKEEEDDGDEVDFESHHTE
jgi:hypothetical protein